MNSNFNKILFSLNFLELIYNQHSSCIITNSLLETFPFLPDFAITWNFSSSSATLEWITCISSSSMINSKLKMKKIQVKRENNFAELIIFPSYDQLFQPTDSSLQLFLFGFLLQNEKVVDSIAPTNFSKLPIQSPLFWSFQLDSDFSPSQALLLEGFFFFLFFIFCFKNFFNLFLKKKILEYFNIIEKHHFFPILHHHKMNLQMMTVQQLWLLL